MSVDKVSGSKFFGNSVLATTVIGAGAATIGYNFPLLKKDFPNDMFVREVAYKMKDGSDERIYSSIKMGEQLDFLPPEKSELDALDELKLSGKKISLDSMKKLL